MRTTPIVLVIVTASAVLRAASQTPTIDQLIELERPGSVALSPDGTRVAYTVTTTNWEDNAFETEIFLADARGGEPVQLTRGKKSSSAPAWSPDGRWIAFASDRTDKRQLYVIDTRGGEAKTLTAFDDGFGSFQWSKDGSKIALTITELKTDAAKERDKKYGEYEVVDQDYRMTHLHVLDFDPARAEPAKPRRITTGPFTVGSFSWSPDGQSIAFDHRVDPNIANSGSADISVVNVSSGVVRVLVTQDGPDSSPMWSPDGLQIAFQSAMANPAFFYSNSRIAVVPAAGGAVKAITTGFDEQPAMIDWSPAGILFSGLEKTSSRIYRLDVATGRFGALSPASGASAGGFSFSRDFSTVAFTSGDAKAFPEVYVASVASIASPRKLTGFAAQLKDWTVGNREMISWKSTDGAPIEGVLHKPADFQAGRRYPLLVVIHGGPTGISRPGRVQIGGT